MSRSPLVLSLMMMMTGCALYVRPMSTLTPDDHVVLELNDQGIPDMAPRLGSGTFLIGGKLQSMDSTHLVMSVYSTQSTHALVDGAYTYTPRYPYPPFQQWGGETVTVPKFDVASARVERISGLHVALISIGAIAIGVSTAEIISFAQHRPKLPQIQTPTNPFPTPFPFQRPITLRAWPRL